MGLGSNCGDSIRILGQAIRDLSDFIDTLVPSSVYKTKPQDFPDQADFYNMVALGGFEGTPGDLLSLIQGIETKHGRDRSREILKGPRTLDIDIILFGDRIIAESNLVVPHARLNDRQFVLIPLLEIQADRVDPASGLPFRVISARLPNQGVQKVGSVYGT